MLRTGMVLLVIAVAGMLAWLLATYDFSRLAQLSPGLMALLLALSALYCWLYGVGVAFILRSVGLARGSWRVFLVVSGGGTASYLGNIQLGIPLRLVLFNRLLAVPYAAGAACVALESACWFGLMGLGLLMAGTVSNTAPWVAVVLLAASGLLAWRFALPLASRVLQALPGAWKGLPLARVRDLLQDLVTALADVRWGWLCAALALFCVNYAIDAVTVTMVVAQYGGTVSPWTALEAVILSYLAGLVTMVPMGIGVRDMSMVALLVRSGVDADVATTAALVQRALRTVVPLAIGVFAVHVLGIRALLLSAAKARAAPGATEPAARRN